MQYFHVATLPWMAQCRQQRAWQDETLVDPFDLDGQRIYQPPPW